MIPDQKIIKILKTGGVGVLPTDTLYGLVGRALDKKAVERIYKLKGRNKNKPFIILISSISDLKKFEIPYSIILQNIRTLKKMWPGKISVILPCPSKKFKFLHRGKKSLAFRLPNKKSLISILKKTGPLVAPSANPESKKPAEIIEEAKNYFGNKVDFYLSTGRPKTRPSTLVSLVGVKLKILRC